MNNLKQVNSQPTSGQFIEVYEYKNQIWSTTCEWQNGELVEYRSGKRNDEWVKYDELDSSLNVTWFVKVESTVVTIETSHTLKDLIPLVKEFYGEVLDHLEIDDGDLKAEIKFNSFNDYVEFIIEFYRESAAAEHIAETVKNQYTKKE